MKDFVFDADVLSTFAKVNKLGLLKKVFGKSKLLIPPAVVNDLKRSKTFSVQSILNSKLFLQIHLNPEEIKLKGKIGRQKSLGQGEIECITVCKARGAGFVTNDSQAINFAEKMEVDVVDLETILNFLKSILNRKELRQLINDIESKDRVLIVNKEKILS